MIVLGKSRIISVHRVNDHIVKQITRCQICHLCGRFVRYFRISISVKKRFPFHGVSSTFHESVDFAKCAYDSTFFSRTNLSYRYINTN